MFIFESNGLLSGGHFCRMTQHLDITPNAFNNYIRAIEKIYDKLFNYKCSFDSKYIQEHLKFSEYFEPFGDIPAPKIMLERLKMLLHLLYKRMLSSYFKLLQKLILNRYQWQVVVNLIILI